MSDPDPENRPNVLKAWQPRFGMRGILLLMLVVSVMAASGSYLASAMRRGERSMQLIFIVFTLSAPLLVMVGVSITHAILRRRR